MRSRKRDAYELLHVRPDAHDAVIRAAYRALAALYHPDSNGDPGANQMMREINEAYARVRTAELRAAYDRELARKQPPPPQPHEPAKERYEPRRAKAPAAGSGTLDFGRYSGWSIAALARHDPDYLRWLSRHSAGVRYRREITERLEPADSPNTTASASTRRKRA